MSSKEIVTQQIEELVKKSPEAFREAINQVVDAARKMSPDPLVINLDEKLYVELPLSGQNKVSVGITGMGYTNVSMGEDLSRIEVVSLNALEPIHEIEITGDEFRSIGYEEEADEEDMGD